MFRLATHNNISLSLLPRPATLLPSHKVFHSFNVQKMPPYAPAVMDPEAAPVQRRSSLKRSSSTSSSSSTSMKRRISFSQNVSVQEVQSHHAMPEEEKIATWYGPQEFESIKRSIVDTLRLMMSNKAMNSDEYTTRGLEFRTPAGAKIRKRNKIEALTVVWQTQVQQWQDDMTDEEAICLVYQKVSSQCRDYARKVGKNDERIANMIAQEDKQLEENTSACEVALPVDHGAQPEFRKQPRRSSCGPAAA